MENEGLISFLDGSGVVIEKPGDTLDAQHAQSGHRFTMEPFADDAAMQRGTVLGCILALFVMGTLGLVLFAGVHALLTGHAF